MVDVYPFLRDLQTRMPQLLETKASVQRRWRRLRGVPFEPDFKALAHIRLASDEVCLDIGANRGQSIDAIRLYHPKVQIIAFEPNPELAARLPHFFPRDNALDVRAFGLAEHVGEATLYVPVYRGFAYDGLASFDRGEAAGWLSAETVHNFDPNALDIRPLSCRAERLDDQGLCPGFLKMDVQGGEAAVLQGGAATVKRYEPIILLENNAEADALLQSWGWTRFAFIRGAFHRDVLGPSNTFYLSDARLTDLAGTPLLP